MTNKTEVEAKLEEAWQALVAAVADLREDEMREPGAVGDWSVKDLLGHIAFWNQKTANDLRLIAGGREKEIVSPGKIEDVDEWNERERRLRKDRPLASVREEWLSSFEEVRQALSPFPPEKLAEAVNGRTVLERLAGCTQWHYQEHLEEILAWQRELETTEA